MRDWGVLVRRFCVVNRALFNSQMRDIHRREGIVARLRAHYDNKILSLCPVINGNGGRRCRDSPPTAAKYDALSGDASHGQ